ncbi:MAG: MXAN_5187 C-terminal domain-containing protein [Polyangiaceae bacterium]|nr:MXAN_5187 C-terminal domain-containing protein [Polyangiaceae bacterium]
MQAEELELEIDELEQRLERLRALYEQYFIGIEKMEPAIPRKDVDRRIWMLRREKIRNTAKRFKLQTIIQRYNTYQQYWHRVLREIELGTFRRHVRKAELITGEDLLTIRSRHRHRHTLKAQEEARQLEASQAAAQATAQESAEARESTFPRPAPVPSPHPRASRPPPDAGILPRPGVSTGKRPSQAPEALPGQRPQTLPGTTLSALLAQAAAPNAPAPANSPLRRAPLPTQPGARPALGAEPPAAPVAPPPVPPARRAPPANLPPPAAARAQAQAQQREAPKPSPPFSPPLAAAAPKPASPRVAAPAPKPTPQVSPPLAAPAPKPASPPVAASAPKPAAPAPRQPQASTVAAEALSEARIQQLHERLVATRRQAGDTTETTLAGLARSLRATEAKLREQHKGRAIDFDITVKDGKAVLRPVLKKSTTQ